MPVCKYEVIAATWSPVSRWSKDGMVFFPLEITMRTSSSVAGLPLGSRSCVKTPCRLGGTFLRANWFSSWQDAQFALYRLRPYSCSLVKSGRRPQVTEVEDDQRYDSRSDHTPDQDNLEHSVRHAYFCAAAFVAANTSSHFQSVPFHTSATRPSFAIRTVLIE